MNIPGVYTGCRYYFIYFSHNARWGAHDRWAWVGVAAPQRVGGAKRTLTAGGGAIPCTHHHTPHKKKPINRRTYGTNTTKISTQANMQSCKEDLSTKWIMLTVKSREQREGKEMQQPSSLTHRRDRQDARQGDPPLARCPLPAFFNASSPA